MLKLLLTRRADGGHSGPPRHSRCDLGVVHDIQARNSCHHRSELRGVDHESHTSALHGYSKGSGWLHEIRRPTPPPLVSTEPCASLHHGYHGHHLRLLHFGRDIRAGIVLPPRPHSPDQLTISSSGEAGEYKNPSRIMRDGFCFNVLVF